MSALKLAYNDIPRIAGTSAASSEDADHPHENLFYGGKTIFWQSASAVTESYVTIDLGAGNTASAEYFIASGVNSMIAQTPGTLTIQLRASTDNFVASNVLILEKAAIVAGDLLGTYDEEIVKTGSLSTGYRYWRMRITTSNAIYHKLRKFYFGQFFDFSGRSPRYPYDRNFNSNVRGKGFISDAGTSFISSSGRARLELELSWHGIPDSVRDDFEDKIGKYASDFPIFIYEPDDFGHNVVKNRVMMGYLSYAYRSHGAWKNAGEIGAAIVEDLVG